VGARLQHIAITGIGGGTPMSKKLSLGLAPLLVIAAFVMTPASALGAAEITWPSCTAPACPHVYKNGVIEPEGEHLNGIAWGNLQLFNAKLGEVECHSIYAGFSVNPTGGGRAEGKVQAFFPYECTDELCTTQLGELKVTNGSTLPWKAEFVENAAKEFFQKTGFKGPTETKKANPATEPGQVEFNVNCTTILASDFFGVTNYKILNNGISIGSSPAVEQTQTEKANPANMRNLESEVRGPIEIKSSLRVEGYGGQELIGVKNP
jgi:hypothetical protein